MERNSKIINGGHGELKLHEKIRLFDNDLPIEHVFKIPSITSITIVIKSLIKKNNKFYLELSLNHCCTKLKHRLVSAKIIKNDFNKNLRSSIYLLCTIS